MFKGTWISAEYNKWHFTVYKLTGKEQNVWYIGLKEVPLKEMYHHTFTGSIIIIK